MIKLIYFTTLCIFITSCNNGGNITYKYAIKDFSKQLQPLLTDIVTKGIVEGREPCLRDIATDKELIKLTKSEHPVLRASAYREILQRKTFDHYKLLLENLSDTAMVQTDAGEFGFWYRKVSDDLLIEANWGKLDTSNKIEALLITKHNYLKAAYLLLYKIKPQEKYYVFIKDMATRYKEYYFGLTEFALYGLAAFKKNEDLKIISSQMKANVWKLSTVSFNTIADFPDTAYFQVLQDYYHRTFLRLTGLNFGDGFSSYQTERAKPQDFIYALINQKSINSAVLIDSLLTQIPINKNLVYKDEVYNYMIKKIWETPCPAYINLRLKIKAKRIMALKGEYLYPLM